MYLNLGVKDIAATKFLRWSISYTLYLTAWKCTLLSCTHGGVLSKTWMTSSLNSHLKGDPSLPHLHLLRMHLQKVDISTNAFERRIFIYQKRHWLRLAFSSLDNKEDRYGAFASSYDPLSSYFDNHSAPVYASLQFPNYRLVFCLSSSFLFGYESTFMQRCAGQVVHVHLMLLKRCTTHETLFDWIMLRMSISGLPIMAVPILLGLPVKRWRKRFAETWETFFCRDASLCLHIRLSER